MCYCAYTRTSHYYMYVHGSRHAIPSLSKTLIHVTQTCLNRFRPLLLQSTNPLIFISVALFPVSHQPHNSHVAWSLFQIASIIVRYSLLLPLISLVTHLFSLSLSPSLSHLISHHSHINIRLFTTFRNTGALIPAMVIILILTRIII